MCVLCIPLEESASVVGLLTSVDEELVFYILHFIMSCDKSEAKVLDEEQPKVS